jgi:hypothetical protein
MEKKKGKPSDNSFVVYLTPDIEKRLRKAIYLEKEKLIDKGRSPNEISKSGVAAEQIEKWLKSKGY